MDVEGRALREGVGCRPIGRAGDQREPHAVGLGGEYGTGGAGRGYGGAEDRGAFRAAEGARGAGAVWVNDDVLRT